MLAAYAQFIREKYTVITFSSEMKNLPIAVGIAVMSFKGLVMFPIAVAFAFQMLTAVSFYQLFLRSLPAGSPVMPAPLKELRSTEKGLRVGKHE